MARQARSRRPGQVVHVISRFVNREARMLGTRERREYLGRVAAADRATDWAILAFALMSTHVHWVFVTGESSLAVFFKSLHAGFAHWLNSRQGRIGPVFASRPKEIYLPSSDTLRVIAYVHNNPCRAGVVDSPRASRWTSHRAYMGMERAPDWLDVELGLRLSGYDASSRAEFEAEVESRRGSPRDPFLSGDELERARRTLRRELGTALEIGPPRVVEGGAVYDLVSRASPQLHRRWAGDLTLVVKLVARAQGIAAEEICSRNRQRDVACARKVAVVVASFLHRPLSEMAGVLGISAQAASQLCRAGMQIPIVVGAARDVVEQCWAALNRGADCSERDAAPSRVNEKFKT